MSDSIALAIKPIVPPAPPSAQWKGDDLWSVVDDRSNPCTSAVVHVVTLTGVLYTLQKFDSEAERLLSVILDRDSLKWFKPAKGQAHQEVC